MHQRLLPGEMSRWYRVDVFPPLAASIVLAAVWRIAVPEIPDGLVGWGLLLVVMITTVAVSIAVSTFPRSILWAWFLKLRVFAR
jgi:hypothetical protein